MYDVCTLERELLTGFDLLRHGVLGLSAWKLKMCSSTSGDAVENGTRSRETGF